MKFAAALVVAGVLSIGAAACGSGSSSDATQSASDVPKKEAGLFSSRGTRLAVVNKSRGDLEITICGNGNCKPARVLKYGESEDMAAEDVNGWIRYDEDMDQLEPGKQPIQVDFTASNPDVGTPKIELTTSSRLCDLGQVAFRQRFPGDWDSAPLKLEETGRDAQQQSTRSSLCQYKLVGSRDPDTSDYKMLTLTAFPQGADFPDIPYAG
jgi:hypothetical protein